MTDNNSILPKRRGLGRGLDALFEDTEVRAGAPNADNPRGQGPNSAPPMMNGGRIMMPITALQPGQYQPRRAFHDETVHALAQSIAQHGIIQPLLVRPLKDTPGKYEIIAGERRWRAAQKAGLHDVPVVVNEAMTDREALQLGLIENLQREDLNPFDEAAGYQRLMDEFQFTPERLGEMIGKSRSHVANTLRLLQLSDEARGLVLKYNLSAGHARAVLGVPTGAAILELAIKKGLSVRQVEKLAEEERQLWAMSKEGRRTAGDERILKRAQAKMKRAAQEKDVHIVALEKQMTDALGLKVSVEMEGDAAGYVHIDFKDLDQLDEVIKRVRGA